MFDGIASKKTKQSKAHSRFAARTPRKVHEELQRAPIRSRRRLAVTAEMSDDEVNAIMELLRQRFKSISSLQPVHLGECMKHRSVPRFAPVIGQFVQILNVGDHWICATNCFSGTHSQVHIYDSVYETAGGNAVVQLSSLLRRYDEEFIEISIRNSDQQPPGTRLCGFYAVAAAISVCNGVDPSGNRYDPTTLQAAVRQRLMTKSTDVILPTSSVPPGDVAVQLKERVHCLCQGIATDPMRACCNCGYKFHEGCIGNTKSSETWWFGPCCQHIPARKRLRLGVS